MKKRHIDLMGREKAWLRVLAAFALDEHDGDQWSAALKWLRAEPLESDEITLLGLDAADNEGRGDSSAQEINNLSFQRLRGLCQLASYYRPFLFCFDQTEFYASDAFLIKTLGNCIEQLYVDLPNHLTIITANEVNWTRDILPKVENPQRDKIDSNLRMEGIRIQGARELITERLKACDIDVDDIASFFANGWLDQVFAILPERGVRGMLKRAAERFRELASKSRTPKQTLEDLFNVEVNEVRSKKALMAYNQDALMWFVKDISGGLEKVQIGSAPNCRYFSWKWAWPDRLVYFAFEGGDHGSRWKSIAREAISMAGARGERTFFAYIFRTPELRKVPRPTWAATGPVLEEAKAQGFHIFELTLDQVCELHAARELYSDALQGNIDYSGAETLTFLQARFTPFLKEIAFRKPVEVKKAENDKKLTIVPTNGERKPQAPPIELDAEKLRIVLDTVREQRIVDIAVVLGRLGTCDLRDPLLRSVEAHPNLKAHACPKTIFLQWRITA